MNGDMFSFCKNKCKINIEYTVFKSQHYFSKDCNVFGWTVSSLKNRFTE